MKTRFFLTALAAALIFSSACGDDDDDGQQANTDGGAGSGGAGEGNADGGTAGDEPDGGEPNGGEPDAGAPLCPNGDLDDLEECDDGNLNNRDGCTRLCVFTCTEDDDCDDLNICNGTETCNDEHVCRPGKDAPDGEYCGPSLSCWAGICVPNGCGDGRPQGDEECDDGDLDETNGCTTECKYTCVKDDSERDCTGGDLCAGQGTCDDDTHTCSGGTALDNETACTIVSSSKGGWCQSGVCVPTDCGNGAKEGSEECDEGDKNGTKGVDCSIDCKIVKCGNGIIEGDEQCDDGKLEDYDGCDSGCRAELVHRMRLMNITTHLAPKFCVYPDQNRLAEAFPGAVELLPGFPLDTLDFVNQGINSALDEGSMQPLLGILDSSDTSMKTSDDEIVVALLSGALEDEEWVAGGPRLDFPFLVEASGLVDGKAINSLPAEQTGGGFVVTTEPSDMVVSSPLGGSFVLREMMLRTIFDVSDDKMSNPEAPPELADSVKLPEESGVGPAEDPYVPAGRMCGAQPLAVMQQMPLMAMAAQFCCRDDGGAYRGCGADQSPPDCDGMGDILLHGCFLCIDMLNPGNGSVCTPGCSVTSGFPPIVEPIEPDIDIDGDGTKDAFSTVMAFESVRIRVRGLTE